MVQVTFCEQRIFASAQLNTYITISLWKGAHRHHRKSQHFRVPAQKPMIAYKELTENDITRELFGGFIRRQIVTKCLRKIDGEWVIRDDPFIDDWSEDDYSFLVSCLKNTAATGGFVCGAFIDGTLKGFVSVEAEPIGSAGQYMDLSSIHVSADARKQGIGRELFSAAKRFAKSRNAKKLYISAHSAVESQAFYCSMGCVEAKEYNAEHVEKEPFDCQLECEL